MPATALALNVPGATTLSRAAARNISLPRHEVYTLTPEKLKDWTHPLFQRPLLINPKVVQLARNFQREAAEDPDGMCIIPETVSFGRFEGRDYLVDGQHRIFGAFAIAAGLKRLEHCEAILEPEHGTLAKCALVDAKITDYESMADMAEAFARAQEKLVALKPDDLLRAREETNTNLRDIRRACPFVGYEKNRNTKGTIVLSMSTAIRTWFGSGMTPSGGPEADRAQRMLDEDEAKHIIAFLKAAERAGWVSELYPRLWGQLNLGINMWLWRKTVMGVGNKFRGGAASMVLTPKQYSECMEELRKSPRYQSDLAARALRYKDRLPTYDDIKALFGEALERMGLVGARFPPPQGWDQA